MRVAFVLTDGNLDGSNRRVWRSRKGRRWWGDGGVVGRSVWVATVQMRGERGRERERGYAVSRPCGPPCRSEDRRSRCRARFTRVSGTTFPLSRAMRVSGGGSFARCAGDAGLKTGAPDVCAVRAAGCRRETGAPSAPSARGAVRGFAAPAGLTAARVQRKNPEAGWPRGSRVIPKNQSTLRESTPSSRCTWRKRQRGLESVGPWRRHSRGRYPTKRPR